MNTLLVYGKTGSTKTTQLRNIALRLRELYQKRGIENPEFRYIGADSGWGPADDIVKSPENPGGFVEAMDISIFRNPFGVLNAIGDGRWLVLKEDPKTKEKRWEFSKETRLPDNLCGYLMEGLNTIADACLQDHITHNRKLGESLSSNVVVYAPVEGGTQAPYTLGAAAQSHYGQVQRFLLTDLLPKMKSLKRMDGSSLPWLIMTAHEAEGSDDFSKAVLSELESMCEALDEPESDIERELREMSERYDLDDDGVPYDISGKPIKTPGERAWERYEHIDDTWGTDEWTWLFNECDGEREHTGSETHFRYDAAKCARYAFENDMPKEKD